MVRTHCQIHYISQFKSFTYIQCPIVNILCSGPAMNTHSKKQNIAIPDPMDHLNNDALNQQYFFTLPSSLNPDDVVQLIQPDTISYVSKPEVLNLGLRWRIWWYVRVYQSRDKSESLCRPDLYSSTRCIIPYINGSESSSLYTCNTSWHSVHYIIRNKPLVRLTTVHYQSTVSMISFAQVLTAQWSDTIPCWNVQFQVGIASHDIPFQHSH